MTEVDTSPALVASAFNLCVTHQAIDHDDGRAWRDCRFRQLFYFENPMDEHTLVWSDEIAARGRTPRQRWGTCCPDDPECEHSFLSDAALTTYLDTPLTDVEAAKEAGDV